MEPEVILRELKLATELVLSARDMAELLDPPIEMIERYMAANFAYEALIGTEGTCLNGNQS